MQQRRLRLGDIVDDYCPRERRITNHAIVAIVEDEVKQTRCATCDTEHEYKQARVPSQRRKKDAPSGLPGEPAAAVTRKRSAADQDDVVHAAGPEEAPNDEPAPLQEAVEFAEVPMAAEQVEASGESYEDASEPQRDERPDDDGPVHRRLIRATLPRPEGQQPERKLPEFTMHQREVNGNRAGRGGPRRGPRQGQMRSHQGGGQFSRPGGGPRQGGPRHGTTPGSGQGQHGPQGNRPAQGPRRKRRR
jgi:hypothetical protein